MRFTDDKLRYWRKVTARDSNNPDARIPSISNFELKALLARLEAAELVCSGINAEHKSCLVQDCLACRIDAWRKASGRD